MARHNYKKRTLALALAGLMAATCVVPAGAVPIQDGVAPTCDEAYYATLDYYGNLLDGSVVKSYALNGAGQLTDYGVYDEVVNLTDGTPVSLGEGRAAFQFEQAPGHFYFEGKTKEPFQALPWTVTLRYTLNGVPARAEELAGKQGVVEILLDIVPNPRASSYARYNYTLEAMALFNEDDILSLEAQGAQVQLVGNLRTVLFMCLPGEERHFTIRVGSDDFSFNGMTILMVPATLAQLEEIAKLSQRKDDLEEDYRALSGSLDALLDALNEVQDGLYASASGLDRLDTARGTISQGKDQLYTDAGVLRGDLSNLADLLEPVEQRTLALSQTISGSKAALNGMADTAVSLQAQLESMEKALEGLEKGSGDVKEVIRTAADMKSSLRSLQRTLGSSGMSGVDLPTNTGDSMRLVKLAHSAYLTGDMTTFADTLQKLQAASGSTGGASPEEVAKLFQGKDYMTFEGFCTQITGSASKGKDMSDLWTVYSGGQVDVPKPLPTPPSSGTAEESGNMPEPGTESGSAGDGSSEPSTPDSAPVPADPAPGSTGDAGSGADSGGGDDSTPDSSGSDGGSGNGGADSVPNSGATDEAPDPDSGAGSAPDSSGSPSDGKDAGGSQSGDNPMADVIVDRLDSASDRLNQLQSELNSTLRGVSRATGAVVGDLAGLCAQLDELVDLIDDAEDLSAALRQSSGKIRSILDGVAALQLVLNEYEPTLQESVASVGTLSTAAVSTLRDLETLLADTEALMKTSGSQLDDGTHQALKGLSATLRQTAKAMAATGDVRDAKATINTIIEDTWLEYTGDVNNILMMDAGAEAVSLTDSRNPAPSSVQILIRTQEIKAEELTAQPLAAAAPEQTTFWGRVAQMFQDFWQAVTRIFRGKGN
jgi:putative membrane protein